MVKAPRTPPERLYRDQTDIVDHPGLLWRIHRTAGRHVIAWNRLRTFGPLESMRWDPHPEPTANHPGYGVLYAAGDITTAVAETFQQRRHIDITSGDPVLLAWTPTRPLRLLDLTGQWLLRNNAAHALNHAPKNTCRRWARHIHDRWPDLDGLRTVSTLTGDTNIVLFNPAASSLPETPEVMRSLTHPAVIGLLIRSANNIGYRT